MRLWTMKDHVMVSWMWPQMKAKTCPQPDAGCKSKDHFRKEAALQLRMRHLLQELFLGKLSMLFTAIEI